MAKKNQSPVTHESPYSFQSFVSFVNDNFSILLLMGLFFIGGFFSGATLKENQLLKDGLDLGSARGAAVGDTLAPEAAAPTGPTAEQLAAMPEITDADHIRGNRNAKIILVEYSDFECPFCGRFAPTLDQVKEEYGDDVAIVYRHFPLAFHPQAQPAAEASECVNKLGGGDAFWKFHDAIFEVNATNGGITEDDIYAAVGTAGVNADAVRSCVESGEFTQLVQDHMAGGQATGVNGTPGTILISADGEREMISGALPFAQVKTVIDKYIE